MQLDSGNILYTRGEEISIGGLGFLVNNNIKDKIVEYKGVSSRVASLTLKISSKYQLQVVQVYATTTSHDDEEVEEFYEQITETIEKNKSYYKIIMRDFNAKTGAHQQGDGITTGHFGYGQRNERGTRLVQFAISKNLTIGNTLFKKGRNKKWTWERPSGMAGNEIDYILTNKTSI